MLASKPTKDDFYDSAKITALGIVIVGIAGLIVYVLAVVSGV